MSPVLCIETSTKVCSVCIAHEGGVLAVAEERDEKYTHAEKLNVFIEEVIRKSGVEFKDLKAVAVSEGPGSYTGLRIGVSAAKGIAFACNIPVVAVNTLRAMAGGVVNSNSESLYIPMIDARRMEVFCAGFTGNLEPVFETRAQILDENAFPEKENFKEFYFFGNGAEKAREILEPMGGKFIPEVYASSVEMAPLAIEKFQNSDFVDTAYFEPFYLKDFVAGKPKGRLA